MEPTSDQIKKFNTLLSKCRVSDMKRDMIHAATNGRTDRTKEMSYKELNSVIEHLFTLQPKSKYYGGNKKRRRILSICHQLPFHLGFTIWSDEKQRRVVDMKRLDEFLKEKGHYKKALNYHTPEELSGVIVQFENMLKTYLKK